MRVTSNLFPLSICLLEHNSLSLNLDALPLWYFQNKLVINVSKCYLLCDFSNTVATHFNQFQKTSIIAYTLKEVTDDPCMRYSASTTPTHCSWETYPLILLLCNTVNIHANSRRHPMVVDFTTMYGLFLMSGLCMVPSVLYSSTVIFSVSRRSVKIDSLAKVQRDISSEVF